MSELARELSGISVFEGLPEGALEWLASHMSEQRFAPGDFLARTGDPLDRMYVILEGELRSVNEGSADLPVFTVSAGEVTGMLPYSRATTFPLAIRAAEAARIAWLPAASFPEMLSLFPELGPRLVRVMADRIRETARAREQHEKLAALGKLSAGLAHELNNPVAAARRVVQGLRDSIAAMCRSDQRLGRLALSSGQRDQLAGLEESTFDLATEVVGDPLERSDREQELGAWLEAHDVEDAWALAADLAEAAFDLPKVERIANGFPPAAVGPVLRRLASSLLAHRLLNELDSSTSRISELVRAIKEYSYMDQGAEQDVDLHQGLENTLVILRHRFKKGIKVIRDYDPGLPHICARGSELNQVWTNLIDNAVDAMNGQGELRIRTSRELDGALVEVADTGSGIPPEIQPRVFEPFFTTKSVGVGTGLGLDTVYRIVRAHGGNVRLQSRPGETKFQVWLPLEKGEHP